MSKEQTVTNKFRALVESAERKFARVRDTPLHPYGGSGLQYGHLYHKAFKAYMELWKCQLSNRAELMDSGLQRWQIGEIASRIGQLYFNQYLRSSEARFLLESYIFYEAIFYRKYFEGSEKDRGIRFKELRFYARFLMVAMVLNRVEMVKLLVERFQLLVDDSKVNFRNCASQPPLRPLFSFFGNKSTFLPTLLADKGTNFKEWRLVLQEIVRFTKADSAILNARPLRYNGMFDSYPASLPYVARYHARRLLKFGDAVLTSYHKNEVKFAELTLDTFRMLQCLEWEPSGSFYGQQPVKSKDNGTLADKSVTSGLIDMNSVAEMTDPTLPPNPKKAILYRPSVTQFLAVIAAVCEELPADNVVLIYLSTSGSSDDCNTAKTESSKKASKPNAPSYWNHEQSNGHCENYTTAKGNSNQYFENYLLLGPSRNVGSNILFPGDIIPFTRRPLFLIIDSDSSHSFKVISGAERGEPVALFLSHMMPSSKNPSSIDTAKNGSQFTLFLTAPLQAFCQLVDYDLTTDNMDMYNDTESIISSAFSEWEQILCTSTSLDIVWAQLLSDPFLRRLILRFIFCRAVLTLFSLREKGEQYLPICIPELPSSLAVTSKAVQPAITRLSSRLNVTDCFSYSS